MSLSAKRIEIVLLCLLFAGCGIIPLLSYDGAQTEPVGTQKATKGILSRVEREEFSGASMASLHVPWYVTPDCRKTMQWEKKKRTDGGDSPIPLAEYGKDEHNPLVLYCAEPEFQTDPNLIALALSGGGSRSAVFAAQVIFELQRYGLMDHVDIISAVSGGAFTAALYVLSTDNPDNEPRPAVKEVKRCEWKTGEEEAADAWLPFLEWPSWELSLTDPCQVGVFTRLQRDFEWSTILNLFWPTKFLSTLVSQYDRTDVLAETLSHNLFNNARVLDEAEFRFQDLNPRRPSLIINATNFTKGTLSPSTKRLNFTFTQEEFAGDLGVSLAHYPIAKAVAASSAFPGFLNYVTLNNRHQNKKPKYMHVFDGGSSDNLGLTAIRKIIEAGRTSYNDSSPQGRLCAPTNQDTCVKRIVVFEADATAAPRGRSGNKPDPRRPGYGYVLDWNFVDAFDTLMTHSYEGFRDGLKAEVGYIRRYRK